MTQTQHHRFVSNSRCEYFPCHNGIAPEQFNCLFCYCPLYVLDDRCGGQFSYTKDGVKDCSACTLPHSPQGYDHIVSRCGHVTALMEQRRNEKPGETP